MQTVKTTFLVLIYIALLGACGLKGPLYLPDENPVTQPDTEQESVEAADAVKDKKDAEDAKKKSIVTS